MATQQWLIGVNWQRPCETLQVSVVQAEPSLHCPSLVQHPEMARFKQVWVDRSQTSAVQTLPSPQSVFWVQVAPAPEQPPGA